MDQLKFFTFLDNNAMGTNMVIINYVVLNSVIFSFFRYGNEALFVLKELIEQQVAIDWSKISQSP